MEPRPLLSGHTLQNEQVCGKFLKFVFLKFMFLKFTFLNFSVMSLVRDDQYDIHNKRLIFIIVYIILINLRHTQQSTIHGPGQGRVPGGLIVVGSYVPKTNAQYKVLIEECDVENVVISVSNVIEAFRRQNGDTAGVKISGSGTDANIIEKVSGSVSESKSGIVREDNRTVNDIIESLSNHIDSCILNGRDVVLCTSRTFIEGATLTELALISNTVTEVVKNLKQKLRFVVAKGGITSHDVAYKSFGIKTASVVGQIEPGVPVWKVHFFYYAYFFSLFIFCFILTFYSLYFVLFIFFIFLFI